jgi:ribosomal protein S18 acetylase RimI-like enzyme
LLNIEIAPEFRGRGIGTGLIQDVLIRAAQRLLCVKLQVLKVNLPAQSLYERLGFRVTGETPTHLQMQSP